MNIGIKMIVTRELVIRIGPAQQILSKDRTN